MEKLELKKEVLEQARNRQRQIINDFKRRIDEIRQSEANINEDQYDHGQKSMDESGVEMMDDLSDELRMVNEEMEILNKMHVGDRLHDTVVPGAVVRTDKKIFYPSVSVEEFDVNGEEYYGISTKAPLYQEMKGLKAGDTFTFKGDPYRIIDIF